MSLPLHPLMVHLPLALALLMPLFVAAAVWGLWSGRFHRRAWLAIAALQLLLVLTAVVAMKTGEREEDRVEGVVPRSAMHLHEEYAEQFTWGATAVLAFALVVFVPAAGRSVTVITLLGTIAVAGLALRVGHAGGQLVYAHNAGAAYVKGSPERNARTVVTASEGTETAARRHEAGDKGEHPE